VGDYATLSGYGDFCVFATDDTGIETFTGTFQL
jgi:hypothetical protein